MAEPSTRMSERALAALIDALDEGALVFDEGKRCRAAGRAVGEIFGFDPRTAIGLSRADVVHRIASTTDAPEALASALGEALAEESTTIDPIVVVDPHPRVVVWTSVPIRGETGSAGRIDIVRDVTRERGAERATEILSRRLEEVTTIDEPTGLANRKTFEREIEKEHRRSQRAWLPYAVMRVQVDALVDAGRQEAMDDLLRCIGEELRTTRREYDVVARFADDEFALLLPGADAAAANAVVQRALSSLRANAGEIVGSRALPVGAAVWIPPSSDGPIDMIRRAGEALETARDKPLPFSIDAGFSAWKEESSEAGDRPSGE